METTEPTLNTFTVTCHTKNCENGEVAIEVVSIDTAPVVICGACMKKITDVVSVPVSK